MLWSLVSTIHGIFFFSCFEQSRVLNDLRLSFVLTVTQIWYSFEFVFCVRVCVVCFFVVILFCFVFSCCFCFVYGLLFVKLKTHEIQRH